MLARASRAAADSGVAVSIETLRRSGGDEDGGFIAAVAAAYEAGLAVSFEGLFAGEARRRIALPGYPFQRRSHWLVSRER